MEKDKFFRQIAMRNLIENPLQFCLFLATILFTKSAKRKNIKFTHYNFTTFFGFSGSGDTNLKLWDIRRKGCIFTYKGHSETVTCLKFSPDGQWVASGGEEGAVKVSI